MKRKDVLFCLAGLLLVCSSSGESGTLFVSTGGNDVTGNGSPGNPFLTIQRGVNAALNGDTVRVLPGTYLGTVNVNKSLVLAGSDRNTTTIGAPGDFRTNSAYDYPLTNFVTERAIVHIGAAQPINVTMSGFLVDGRRLGPDVSQSIGYSGILVEGCVAVIAHNNIRNILPADSLGSTWESTKLYNGKGIYVRGGGTAATIADNYLEQVNRFYILINASDNGTLPAIIPSATVDGNTIIGKGVYNGGQKGIWFNSGAWGIASGNTISNLDFPNAAIEPERASGIVAYGGNAAPGFRRIIVNNTVSASSFINNKGIYIAGTGDSIAGNTITGFRWGIELHDGISTQIVRNTITGGQVGVLIGTNSTTPVTWTTTIGGDSPSDKNIITGQMPHASGGNAIALGFRDLVGGSTFLGTVPIDARNNDFGVYEDSLIRSRIWDRSDTTMIGGHLVDTVHYSPFFSPGEMIRASVKVNLEGPFNTATSLMNTTLYTSGTLAAYFTGRVIPVGAVDSINIEIRDSLVAVRATVRRYCAAWLLADGTIRGFADTTKNYVEFAALAGSYYIAVRQRSHVTIMSAMRQQLSTGSMAMYDFTTSQSSAYGTNSLKPMGARFAMFTGDVNQNGLINAADRLMVKNNTGLGGYNVADANLNGLVNAADRLVVKNNTGVSSQVP